MARRGKKDHSGIGLFPEWSWAWPVNRRIIYNRASVDLNGKPYNMKKAVIYWNPVAVQPTGTLGAWVGDVPDGPWPPMADAKEGKKPFIMQIDGVGSLFGNGLKDGMSPACAKACPTETLKFGNRNDLIAKAQAAKKTLYGVDDLNGLGVVYALEGPPEKYGLPASPSIPLSIFLWKDVIKPLGILGFWGSIGAMLLHYVTIGPKKIDDDSNAKGADHE
jgi:hypothetical protein